MVAAVYEWNGEGEWEGAGDGKRGLATPNEKFPFLSFTLFFFFGVCVCGLINIYSRQEHRRVVVCQGSCPFLSYPPTLPSPSNVLFAATSPSAWVFVCRCSEHLLELLSLIYACSAPASPSLASSLSLSHSLSLPLSLCPLCSCNLCSLQELIPARETAAYLFLWVLAYSTATLPPECSPLPTTLPLTESIGVSGFSYDCRGFWL